ncbi:glutamate--tRNA ligase family protein [Candidatus Vidania fulgoroideorum]
MLKTRFAPSPSGYMHIGNLRVAVLSFSIKNTKNGLFFLRIDDTDYKINKINCLINIIKTLSYFKIKYDRVFFQSKRFRLYKKIYFYMIKKKIAYFNEGAVYIKVSLNFKSFKDVLRGHIINKEKYNDFIIVRKNGIPTYSFCSVVDDYYLEITHIFRGEDHIKNTFKQMIIQRTLNYNQLNYFHIPLVLDKYGKKISKRKKSNNLKEVFKMGILRKSIICYIFNMNLENIKSNNINSFSKFYNLNYKTVCLKQKNFNACFLLKFNTYFLKRIKNKYLSIKLKKKKISYFFFRFFKKKSSSFLELKNFYIDFISKIGFKIKVFNNKLKYIFYFLFVYYKKIIFRTIFCKDKITFKILNVIFFGKKLNNPGLIDIIKMNGKKKAIKIIKLNLVPFI